MVARCSIRSLLPVDVTGPPGARRAPRNPSESRGPAVPARGHFSNNILYRHRRRVPDRSPASGRVRWRILSDIMSIIGSMSGRHEVVSFCFTGQLGEVVDVEHFGEPE